MKTVDISETIAASDLNVGRCRQLIEFMKVCEYLRSRSFLYYIVGLPRSGKKVWKMKFFPGQGKVREFQF